MMTLHATRRLVAVVLVLAAVPSVAHADPTTRLKDVVSLQGPEALPLMGYGLIVGLNKTGDRRQTIFSTQSLANILQQFGLAVNPGEVKVENIAAVLVTANLPAYARPGVKLDITASSIGDARSLQGGTLLATALRGPSGQIHALAQGPLVDWRFRRRRRRQLGGGQPPDGRAGARRRAGADGQRRDPAGERDRVAVAARPGLQQRAAGGPGHQRRPRARPGACRRPRHGGSACAPGIPHLAVGC